MRAVNLIPSDQQRGAGGAAGKSGGGAYFLLGGLALIVAMLAVFVSTGRSVSDKKDKVASLTAQAAAAEAKAGSLTSYTKFASIRESRVDTVKQLAAARFDWAHAMREVADNLPRNAWLTAMTGTTSPAVSIQGGTNGALRSGLDEPAIIIQGCTTSLDAVSALLTRLRQVDGVDQVSLEDSTKGAAGSGGSSGGGDCRGGHAKYPLFNVDVFFKQDAAALAASTATTATTTAPASTDANTTNVSGTPTAVTASQVTPVTSSTPASTGTPATTSTPASSGTPATTTTPGGTN
jgi:Tfp pilus assembly protein PilN